MVRSLMGQYLSSKKTWCNSLSNGPIMASN